MSTEDKKTPKSVMLFPNGNTAAFDEKGEQIGELQKAWMILYFEFLESQGIDPTKIQDKWTSAVEDTPNDGPYLCFIEEPQQCAKLLEAEQELYELRGEFAHAISIIVGEDKEKDAKISELEETISAKDAKLEAILKGLREADDALSFTNEHARAKQIIRDLLKEHKS